MPTRLGAIIPPLALSAALFLPPAARAGASILDHPTRQRVHAAIVDRPGILFSQLRRVLDLSTGVVDHHTRMLLRAHLVATRKEGRHRAFYPAGGVARAVPAPHLGETAQRLLDAVVARGGADYATLVVLLRRSKASVCRHAHNLEAMGLVHVEHDGGHAVVRASDVRTGS